MDTSNHKLKSRLMRYRIKITTFKTGRKTYLPQKKCGSGLFAKWWNLNMSGKPCHISDVMAEEDTREEALIRIDRNVEGNGDIDSVEFEYIDK